MSDTPMDAATLEALKGSIAKWEAIVAGTGTDDGPHNCPLCQLFNPHMEGSNNSLDEKCKGCPVAQRTGEHFCGNTPYEYFSDEDDEGYIRDSESAGWIEAAQVELDFLRSLLPTAAT